MARDATATRDQLIVAGLRLMADQGPFRVSLAAIHHAAGQKNASALHYHFGGREGLLQAIIDRHNSSIEAHRKDMLDELGPDPSMSGLVRAVIEPMAAKLDTDEGRDFLRVVAQLSVLFDRWDEGGDTPAQAERAFVLIAERLTGVASELRPVRVATFLSLVSESLAQRALQLAIGRRLRVDHVAFMDNLERMSVGALTA
jgi:TetR/AcrR family transcriptional regulator, regulator of cefoperazone and chloramphenicol sensitivity